MRTVGRDRLWLLGGLLMALVLLAVAWFFFISKQNDETSSVKDDKVSAQSEQTAAQRELNHLKTDNANLQKYEDELAAAQQALPNDPGIPAFVLELHAAADSTGVGITSVRFNPPVGLVAAAPTVTSSDSSSAAAAPAAATPSIYSMQVTLVAGGPTAALSNFLRQVQQIQPRAVLITNVTEGSGTGAGNRQDTVILTAFVDPGDGSTPTIAPTGAATPVS
jgi:hypothetical protein